MITGFTHIHSSFRYLVLLFIVLAFLDALLGLTSGKEYKKSSKLFALGALILSHVQGLVGITLYFIGSKGFNALMNSEGVMKDATLRFFTVEHALMMVVAITLITMGYSKAKKKTESKAKFRSIVIFYGIALLIIFIMIPWPFLKEYGTWM